MIEVFKTNVQTQEQAKLMLGIFSKMFPGFKINFDLDDCDKILRVEGMQINANEIISIFINCSYQCEILS